MAFHVACPITCRKICFCIPGTPAPLVTQQGSASFLQDVMELERLLAKPAFLAAGGEETVEVLVPRLPKDLKTRKGKLGSGQTGGESGDDTPISKKAFMRKKATMAAIAVAEAAALAEQAKRAADAARFGASRQLTAPGAAVNGMIGQVSCEICFYSEVEGSKGAERMIPCPNCKRRFHRNCLKHWAGNRDLFNWSAWVCGSCRICEVCRRTGEPNKLMFCKRCDGAIHAYCQQPPLKQVPKGPFLCPKHTLCHGCGSRVPGSGVSSRWFLEYTMCDACGRLFIKGKYCSICLKVYRDSEASPMVCCDNCEHWVHARCDAISDEKYYEFQLDNNLRYTCAACRGECYKVKNTSDAVDELWRRRDEADKHLIIENQAAAGLPSREENMKLSPSDDEDDNKLPETHLLKKAVKVLPLKGKDQDEKLATSFESRKHKLDEADTGGGTIKKLKITLPSSHLSKSKELPTAHIDSSLSEKSHKKKNGSVAKSTKYMMHTGESTAAGNEKSSLAYQNAGTNAHADSSLVLDDRENFLSRSQMKHERIGSPVKNPIKSVKFVDNAKARKETAIFFPPSTDKKSASKSDMSIRTVLATTSNDVVESQSRSDEFRSDEGGSEGNSETSQEERDGYFDEAGASQNNIEGSAWGYQGGASKRGLPSFKYRDKISNSNEDAFNSEDLDSNDVSSGMEDVPSSMAEKTNRDATSGLSQDEDSSESPSKKVNVFPSGNTSLLKHGNGNTLRGQRSKRRKHPALESHVMKDREGLDDNRTLQKLGRDAIGKKVEVFSSRNKSWCKGRVTEAPVAASHFTVTFDDGRVDTIEFGKRKVRILSHSGKDGRL